jgi:DNA ligase-1
MVLSKLYKSKKGKVQEWEVVVNDCGDCAEIVVTWGQAGGAQQSKTTVITEGKNVGKANETSYLEQANSEAQSKWNKELDKGYRETIESAEVTEGVKILPMLAKVYADHKHKLQFPVYVQPKLDGMRALTYLDGDLVVMLSRKGKEINTTQHIKDELKKVLEANPGLVLDGELYEHGKNFQKLISKVKRDEANDESKDVQYWVYDCFNLSKPNLTYKERFGIITSNINVSSFKNVVMVDTVPCKTEEDIFKEHGLYLGNGFEGSIVRGPNSPYKIDGRSDQLLKLKEFKDAEFEIIGYEQDKNNQVVFECVTPKGNPFKVKPEGTAEEREAMLDKGESYIGQQLTVKYFELTDDGVPRFPVGITIRNYE